MEKLIVQSELCDGCKDCEKACEGVHGVKNITIHDVGGSYYSIRCQQCEDAPCVSICPTGAMTKDGVDSTKCIACGFCSMACPFGCINLAEGSAHKCNLCKNREEGPACMKACSKKAIELLDLDYIKDKKQKEYVSKLNSLGKKPKRRNVLSLVAGTSKVRTATNKEGE